MNYQAFIESKSQNTILSGIKVSEQEIHPTLYDFQKAIVKWALRKGRAAIFADCGLGKTFIQLEWARLIGGTSLIIAPLCVAKQTIGEAKKIGITVKFVRDQSEIVPGINITNYEMTGKINGFVDSVVLDESSILKSLAGKTRKRLTKIFKNTKYRLCCTATPCPNDIAELGNHAEFLGYMTHPEMLASFFVHDSNLWRMKGYAKEPFYKWLASWAVCLNGPEDLGFDGSRFVLPDLNINNVSVQSGYRREGELIFTGLKGIQDRSAIRKLTIDARIKAVADLIANSNGNQWICWCGLNDEADRLTKMLGEKAVNVKGADSLQKKEVAIQDFLDGKILVLVTKPKIAGFGMNFQNAHNMAFVGLSDSYEGYYQCIRRSWRFGQTKQVNAHVVIADVEAEIFVNIKRKEAQAKDMSRELVKNIEEFERIEINEASDKKPNRHAKAKKYSGDSWDIWNGDCVEIMSDMSENSIDLSIYSPPFISLYTYSDSARDLGNCKDDETFFEHYGHVASGLLKVTKTGRNTAVHVSQVPAMLVTDGYIGLKDLRGRVVEEYQRAGWTYHGEIVIQKNPQVQAIRTHAKGLLFAQLKRDSSWLRPGLADYVLLFRKPGDNKVPILPKDISNDEWIRFAHPVWFDINETNVLSPRTARTDRDDKHMCPLQLDVIDRCVRLWSNQGEIVFSPFAGIGSEGYQAILKGRRFLGAELKPEYVRGAIKNLNEAESRASQKTLFSLNGD